MLRAMNKSPGSVPRIRSGTTRQSAQVMNSHSGDWPSASKMKMALLPGNTSARNRLCPSISLCIPPPAGFVLPE